MFVTQVSDVWCIACRQAMVSVLPLSCLVVERPLKATVLPLATAAPLAPPPPLLPQPL